jgi:hypothetical protein
MHTRSCVHLVSFDVCGAVGTCCCANGQGLFRNLRFFVPELEARFGVPADAASFSALAQAQAYEAHRCVPRVAGAMR